MKTARVLAILVVLSTVGCGKKVSIAERERLGAPRGKGDVGVLIERAPAADVEKILADFPQAQVRVLNKEHGLYEIFGVATAEVAARTGGPVNKNQFFNLMKPRIAGLMSIPAPEGLEVAGLPPCRGGLPGPNAVLSVAKPSLTLNGSTIEQGTTVKVNTLSSAANPASPSTLKSALVVIAPDSSAQGNRMLPQNELEFTPDALGVYQIIAVVQDSANSCAMDGAVFIVTANRPYAGPNARELNVNLTQMRHLASVQAQESWQLGQGEGVSIAVIDSGVNYNHPSLAPNILLNAAEIAGNGIDDDNNGFKDDVLGYDFVNSDEFPYDDDGHGSHVAGLAAGKQFGLARRAKILPIKAMTSIGGDIGTVAAALRYAVDRGVKVVNMSLGAAAPLPHPALVSAMAYAESKDVLVVVAAGNGDPQTGLGFSIDEIPVFPASLPNANVLTVGSFDQNSVLSPYSNFGKLNVDVIAPGGNMPADPMFSCAFENPRNAGFIGLSGTSMAAPVVSGIAAQVLGIQPRIAVAALKDLLIKAGQAKPELTQVSVSGRHINALQAVEAAHASNVLF